MYQVKSNVINSIEITLCQSEEKINYSDPNLKFDVLHAQG